jgi:hypothetical protein
MSKNVKQKQPEEKQKQADKYDLPIGIWENVQSA